MTVDRPAMLRCVVRLAPWPAIGATAGAAAVVACVRASRVDDGADLVSVLRVGAVLLAATVATCVEDGSEPLAVASPFGRARRRQVAVAIATSAVVACWLTIAVVAGALTSTGRLSADVIGGVLVELLALCASAWALASITALGGERGSGTRAALGVLLAVLLSLGYPRTMAWLWPPVEAGPAWDDAHVRWMCVGLAALACTAWLSRDPAARWLRTGQETRR